MFLEVIPINSVSFMNFGDLWENVKISSLFKGPALSAFFCQKLKLLQTASNFTYMFLEVTSINSVSFMNFGELWEMSKFHPFSRGRHCRHFFEENWNSQKHLIFHMHVSGSDSNKFCKFYEFWRPLRKCQKFILFLRSTVGIFLSKIETSPNCFMFLEVIPIIL